MDTTHPFRRLWKNEFGQSTVEFALSVVLLVTMIFAVIDLSRAMYINVMLESAAQAGARTAAVTNNLARAEAEIEAKLSGIESNAVTLTITVEDAFVDVELTYTYQAISPFIAPFIGSDGIQFTRVARSRIITTLAS